MGAVSIPVRVNQKCISRPRGRWGTNFTGVRLARVTVACSASSVAIWTAEFPAPITMTFRPANSVGDRYRPAWTMVPVKPSCPGSSGMRGPRHRVAGRGSLGFHPHPGALRGIPGPGESTNVRLECGAVTSAQRQRQRRRPTRSAELVFGPVSRQRGRTVRTRTHRSERTTKPRHLDCVTAGVDSGGPQRSNHRPGHGDTRR